MDKSMLEKMTKMAASDNDGDAVIALRGLQNAFRAEGIDFGVAVSYAFDHIEDMRKQGLTIDQLSNAPAKTAKTPVALSGMPQCWSPSSGAIEIIPPGETSGEPVSLPGASAEHSEVIAMNMKDVLVAAAINKSRFKLKLFDIKNAKGEIVETALQAEYERQGMSPIRVWVNVRGEVAALAAVLRKAVANALPELVAA